MNKLTVLIADDDKAIQDLYKKGLPDNIYEKQFVSDGDDAVALYKKWKPDIILLDILMPIKSGYAALKEIRAEEAEEENPAKKTVIIMATVMSSKEDIIDCAKIGIQGYIIKPFKIKEINQKVFNYYKKFNPSVETVG